MSERTKCRATVVASSALQPARTNTSSRNACRASGAITTGMSPAPARGLAAGDVNGCMSWIVRARKTRAVRALRLDRALSYVRSSHAWRFIARSLTHNV